MAERYQLLTPALMEKVEDLGRDDQGEWLFLSPSEEFKGRWLVEGIYPDFFFDFEDLIGHYRTVSPARLDEFLTLAQEAGYHVVFDEPPEGILSAYEGLQADPPFSLISALPWTVCGLLPFQTQGFNKLVRDEDIDAGLVVWDTGTGKTAFIAAAIKWHEEHGHEYDAAIVVVKKNNKSDIQWKLKALAEINSSVLTGTPTQRDAVYGSVIDDLSDGKKVNLVCNYESIREDPQQFEFITEGRNCLFFWDEMPTRLSNRKTQIYDAVYNMLWRSKGVPKPKWMRQWELTATPIENSPSGLFACVSLMNPLLLGGVSKFEREYCAFRNPISKLPERWHKLDKLEGKIEFMTHRVSRLDPEVAKMFPEVMEDLLVIDWDNKDRHIYDILSGKALKILEEETHEFEDANILALIQLLQMVCDAPSMINVSAEKRREFDQHLEDLEEDELPDKPKGSELAVRLLSLLKRPPTDERHTKFEMLREILQEKHPNEKALVYMTWANYGFPPVTAKLDEWGVSYVTYTGTDKQRQEAKDRFRSSSASDEGGIHVFLSSDKGSDSIDLPEAAVGVNYNLPWTWTRKRQRQGRNDRVDSQLDTIWWYDLIMANSVELRKREIIETKKGYHEALFDGKAIEDSFSAKLTREDLLYILSGVSA